MCLICLVLLSYDAKIDSALTFLRAKSFVMQKSIGPGILFHRDAWVASSMAIDFKLLVCVVLDSDNK